MRLTPGRYDVSSRSEPVSERSGLGLVEAAIVAALDSLGGRADRRHIRNARVLAAVEERIGLAPGYGYEVLLDLARPWIMPVRLVDGQGNYGDRRGDPAASFRYTESRLSPAGEVALAAERGELAPVPIALINGNTHRQGTRPPFRPEGIIGAVREVIRRPKVTGNELISIIGPPDFPTGCTVTGDLAALAAGRPTVLRLQASVTVGTDHRSVTVEGLPPNVNRGDVLASLAARAERRDWAVRFPDLDRTTRLPLADVQDTAREDTDRFVCIPEPGTAPDSLRDQLMDVHGIWATVPVALPRPLPALVRQWVRAYVSEDLLTSLARLADAVARQL
jgi:hypothetical protein